MDGHVASVHGKKSAEYQVKEEDMLDSEQTAFFHEEFYIKEETFENEGEIDEKCDFEEENHDFDEKYDFEQDNHNFDVKQEEKTLDNTNTYECDFCDKTFSRPENVTRHIRTVHEGKKPFKVVFSY